MIRLDTRGWKQFSAAMVDFKAQLRRQISFLKNSCRLYDEGQVEEAIRMAVVLRVIFHDSNRSVSLLQHLGSKSMFLLSTADLPNGPTDHHLSLTSGFLTIPNPRVPAFTCEMRPVFDNVQRREFILLQSWWRKEPIVVLGPDGLLNRRDLILAAANKDGGAHVDSELPDTYAKTTRGAGMEMEIDFRGHPTPISMPFENVHFSSLRQIAYEVLESPALMALT